MKNQKIDPIKSEIALSLYKLNMEKGSLRPL